MAEMMRKFWQRATGFFVAGIVIAILLVSCQPVPIAESQPRATPTATAPTTDAATLPFSLVAFLYFSRWNSVFLRQNCYLYPTLMMP